MPEVFDPNASGGMPDINALLQQQAQIARQRKIAEILRKQASGKEGQMPGGEMVSGIYVRPSPLQAIAPLLNQYQAGQAENNLANQEQQFTKQAGQAQQNWQSQLPQATAALKAQPNFVMQPDASGMPEQSQAQPAQPVTTGQILKHTLAGMQIPGNKDAAELYARGALSEQSREDQQAAIAERAHASQQAQNERLIETGKQKLAEIQLRMSGQISPAEQIRLKELADQTKRYIADKSAAARLGAAEASARARGANVKPVPNATMKVIREAEDVSSGLNEAYSTFKPEYGGISGLVDKVSGTWNPFSGKESEEAANWWKNYNKQGALVERHAMFGTALSAGERTAWREATISPGMNAGVIANNLKARAELAAKFYNKVLQQSAVTGHPQVLDAFDPHPETFEAVEGSSPLGINPPAQQRVPVAPPQRRATDRPAAPARALPPGITRG